MTRTLRRLASRSFSIDLRSLALFRVALGSVVLLDLAVRSTALVPHYLAGGVLLPSNTLYRHFASPYSLYSATNSPVVHVALFIITVLTAALFTVGYRARIAAALLWLLVVSLHARNPLILSNGDVLLNLLLLWSVFLPISKRFSIDTARRGHRTAGSYCSIASVGLLIQIALVLAVTGLSKLASAVWTTDPVALQYALQLRGTALGHYVAALPDVMLRFATHAALGVEILAPIMLFAPAPRVRMAGVVVGVSLMLAIATTLNVGPLPLLVSAGLLAFIPSRIWSQCQRDPAEQPSDFPNTTSAGLPTAIRWAGYLFCAWVSICSAAFAVGQISYVNRKPTVPFPRLAHALGLEQGWQMFVTLPSRVYWLEARGRLVDGSTIDPRSTFASLDPRESVRPPIRSPRDYRWVRWEEFLVESPQDALRTRYAGLLCEEWNLDAAAPRLVSVSLRILWIEPRAIGGRGREEVLQRTKYRCAGGRSPHH